jgi:hypothetical protein
VELMLVATRAVLLPLNALGMDALVLRGEVIPVFALAARDDDFFSGHCSEPLMVDAFRFSLQSSRPGLNR